MSLLPILGLVLTFVGALALSTLRPTDPMMARVVSASMLTAGILLAAVAL
jgi:hypothetical protein